MVERHSEQQILHSVSLPRFLVFLSAILTSVQNDDFGKARH